MSGMDQLKFVTDRYLSRLPKSVDAAKYASFAVDTYRKAQAGDFTAPNQTRDSNAAHLAVLIAMDAKQTDII